MGNALRSNNARHTVDQSICHAHPLRQVPYNYNVPKSGYSTGFICNMCRNRNPSNTRWWCSNCNYDLCENCKTQPTENNLAHEHPLLKVPSNGGTSAYANGYYCNMCRQSNPSTTRWWCPKCNYDLCETCFSKANIPPIQPPSQVIPSNVLPISSTQTETDLSPGMTCVVCMDAPRNATIIHNKTAHMCCCMQCASTIQQGDNLCPVCRQDIEMVIQAFYS